MTPVEFYRRVLQPRRLAYRRKFLRDDGTALDLDAEVILRDLAKFCRAHRSTTVYSRISGQIDPIASAQAEGRREVYLRIVEHLHLDERFLVNLREGARDV